MGTPGWSGQRKVNYLSSLPFSAVFPLRGFLDPMSFISRVRFRYTYYSSPTTTCVIRWNATTNRLSACYWLFAHASEFGQRLGEDICLCQSEGCTSRKLIFPLKILSRANSHSWRQSSCLNARPSIICLSSVLTFALLPRSKKWGRDLEWEIHTIYNNANKNTLWPFYCRCRLDTKDPHLAPKYLFIQWSPAVHQSIRWSMDAIKSTATVRWCTFHFNGVLVCSGWDP